MGNFFLNRLKLVPGIFKDAGMSPYLPFEIGNMEDARGRVVISIPKRDNLYSANLFEINGAAFKEAIATEFLEGRIINMDVFEPFYVTSTPFESLLSSSEIADLALNENRDLLQIEGSDWEELLPEVIVEQMIARYTTVCRENIYLRIIREFIDEVFKLRKRTFSQSYYVPILKLGYWICMLLRSLREEDDVEIAFCRNNIYALQNELPVLEINKIVQTLESRMGSELLEIGNYVDAFYITLKKHYPFPLNRGVYFHAKKECQEWLAEGVYPHYEEYFMALLRENYERASELKQLIDQHYISQSLNGCSN